MQFLGSQAPKPMSVIDQYLIIRQVGSGGRGQVYLARDTSLGRKVALKVINPESIGDEESVGRFLLEARITAKFSHPHIVTVYGVGQYQGSPYVALEYLEGPTLRQRLQEERLGVKESVRIGLAIAEALHEAHRNQVLHRDLKPENVMLPPDGRVRVVDFGLAKPIAGARTGDRAAAVERPAAEQTTLTGGALVNSSPGLTGTPMYMAPEQWMERECTPATDIWALGLILYEMLTGERPYDEPTVFALCGRVCSKDPIPPVALPEVPGDLRVLVARCAEKDPALRATTAEIVSILGGLLHRSPEAPREQESPFRGLQPFTERQADLFFGRDTEIRAFIERLRAQPVMPIIGPSGVGKSSFVQAGVIPRLREQGKWVVLPLRPGPRPFQALASCLLAGDPAVMAAEAGPSGKPAEPRGNSAFGGLGEVELGEQLREFPSRLSLYLNRIANEEDAPVLLFVDQLEEIYGAVDSAADQKSFMRAITGAADDPKGRVRTVMTIRDDFFVRAAAGAETRLTLGHVTVLGNPGPEALRDILSGPLRYTGYRFEDTALVDEMIGALKGEMASLPLIQFVCSRLWEQRDPVNRIIPRAAYEELGGVEGALARHADQLLETLLPPEVRAVRQLLLKLVTPEGTRLALPMSRLMEGVPDAVSDVVDTLIEERILTIRRAPGRDDSDVELVHESLIRDWARLRNWISESREELVFLSEISHAADLWAKRGRRREEVWRGEALEEAWLRAQRCADLPGEARRFLDAGRSLQTARTREKRLMVLAIMLVFAVVVLWFSNQEQDAINARIESEWRLHETEQQLLAVEAELGEAHRRIGALEKPAPAGEAEGATSDAGAPAAP